MADGYRVAQLDAFELKPWRETLTVRCGTSDPPGGRLRGRDCEGPRVDRGEPAVRDAAVQPRLRPRASAGHPEDAIRRSGMAIERWDGARDLAREDSDFDAIRDEPSFQGLISLNTPVQSPLARRSPARQGLAPGREGRHRAGCAY